MRIIHNIGSKETFQATLSGDLYRGRVGAEHVWQGWHCEILITTRDVINGEIEPIYLEGTASDVRYALTQLLAMLEGEETLLREQFNAKAAQEQSGGEQ